jgi:hypothetical protein
MNATRPGGSSGTGTTYEIRVDGHLDDHWSDRLGGLAIVRNGDGTTTLTGRVVDQAHLHGVLAGLRDIAATLLELHAVAAGVRSGTVPDDCARTVGRPGRRIVEAGRHGDENRVLDGDIT